MTLIGFIWACNVICMSFCANYGWIKQLKSFIVRKSDWKVAVEHIINGLHESNVLDLIKKTYNRNLKDLLLSMPSRIKNEKYCDVLQAASKVFTV